jgi:hypothetical protein
MAASRLNRQDSELTRRPCFTAMRGLSLYHRAATDCSQLISPSELGGNCYIHLSDFRLQFRQCHSNILDLIHVGVGEFQHLGGPGPGPHTLRGGSAPNPQSCR